jgi:hypothetical protein
MRERVTSIFVYSIKGCSRMNPPFSDDPIIATNEVLPAAIPSLIDAAAATLDADPNTSRRYLLRASALLRAKHGARIGAESARRSESRGGLLAWQLNRIVDYIDTHLADKITALSLAGLTKVSVGQRFRAFKISVGVTPFHYIAEAMKVGAAGCLTKPFDDDMLLSAIHDAIDPSDCARQEAEMRLLRSDHASGARGHGFGGHRLAKSSAHPVGVAAWIKPDAGCPGPQSMKDL